MAILTQPGPFHQAHSCTLVLHGDFAESYGFYSLFVQFVLVLKVSDTYDFLLLCSQCFKVALCTSVQ